MVKVIPCALTGQGTDFPLFHVVLLDCKGNEHGYIGYRFHEAGAKAAADGWNAQEDRELTAIIRPGLPPIQSQAAGGVSHEDDAQCALALCADAIRAHGVDALPLLATKLVQLWHDNAKLWGNDGGGNDAYVDPNEEAQFQVGYSFATFIDKMGHDNHCRHAINLLDIRDEFIGAANYLSFDTFNHGQTDATAFNYQGSRKETPAV